LAAALAYEKSSRVTNMTYTQMLFALTIDKLVLGHTPGILSIIGSTLILGSAIVVAMQRSATEVKVEKMEGGGTQEDEESRR
jgi:drug/metabolite transporter (DMT)-like permease